MNRFTNPPDVTSSLSIASDVILLLADLQEDFSDLPLTAPFAKLRRSVGALVELAAIFDLPLVVTAVPSIGGDGTALMRELKAVRSDTPVIIRTTSNSLSDARVRAALVGSGRRKLVVAGIVTEVAVQSVSLTAAAEGFDVHVLVDACAGLSQRTEAAAFSRLTQAGVKMSSIPALIGELAGDSAQPKGRKANKVLLDIAMA